MTADVILADFKSKTWVSEANLKQQTIELLTIALMGAPTMVGMEPVVYVAIPYGGQGIDGMEFDTAPSEMNPDQPA